MKILLINNLYPPYIVGGNEMLARDVVDELRRRGHVVHVATGRGKDLPADGQTHQVLNIDLDRKAESFLGGKKPTTGDLFNWHLFNWQSYWGVRRLIRQLAPELVIVWNLYLASPSPLIAATHSGRPTVIQVADKWLYFGLKGLAELVRPPLPWQQRLVKFAQAAIQPLLYRLARPRHVVTISQFIKDYYAAHGFAPETLTPIHLGVPTQLFVPRPRPPVPADYFRLLYVGALWEGKGPQVAVRALGILRRRGLTNVCLDVYGDGTEGFKQWLRGIIAQEGVGHVVALHGFGTREQVLAAYQTHDILVFPSLWDEPFAAVPVEAMSCGMAIVATTAGGTPEAIRDHETGLLVAPNDPEALAAALQQLLTDHALRQRLGQRAAQVARERFDFARYVDRLETYYTSLLRRQ